MRAALLLALAAPLAASAQSASVWPLVPGNTWAYTVSTSFQSASSPPSGDRPDDWTAWTVLDSVDTPAGRLPRVRFGDGSRDGDGTCTVAVARRPGGARFTLLNPAGDAPCSARPVYTRAGSDFSVFISQPPPVPVVIGGDSVAVDTVRTGLDDDGGSGVQRSFQWMTADGIGVTGFGTRLRALGGVSDASNVWLQRAVLSGRVVGQPRQTLDAFWPLAVGNRWEFRVSDPTGAAAGEVVWTAEASGAGLALRMQRVRGGAVVASVTCPVGVVPAGPETEWETRFSLSGCALPDPALAPALDGTAATLGVSVYASAQTVGVGAGTLVADAVRAAERLGTARAAATFARGIGPVAYASASSSASWTARLAFARLGGGTYGQSVVAGEAAPAVAALALVATPNPTRGALALAFTLPEAGEAAVEVVDALGRTVLRHALGKRPAGAGAAQIDLSGVAPGVYVVRLAGGAARASARVSVVR